MNRRPILFALFFVSGFCGLLYQVVWTRMAFASFGIIMPVLSVVISVFMLGLSLGSWAGGRWIGPMAGAARVSPALFYGAAEFIIGVSAWAVPRMFAAGEHWLLSLGEAGSSRYLFCSALVLAVSIFPWCFFMGTTFPFMMAYVRQQDPAESQSFSYLYLANVLGALSGTLLSALVLIEILGFRNTLWVAAAGNGIVAAISVRLGLVAGGVKPPSAAMPEAQRPGASTVGGSIVGSRSIPWILFTTGFVSMAMEVVWIRAFTPVLKTQVYSFALVLAAYLAATFAGSLYYRHQLQTGRVWPVAPLLGLLCIFAFVPVLCNDTRIVSASWYTEGDAFSKLILLLSICPFCAGLGYLTPALIDRYAAGAPAGAGRAYALNVLGCILGPLFASYLVMPHLGDRWALALLTAPLVACFLGVVGRLESRRRFGLGFAVAGAAGMALLFSRDYESQLRGFERNTTVRRDYAASVISFGEGFKRHLLVNGIGMTVLTPVTKYMVHLPMAFHREQPRSALIICFGMGTSFRSALSWDVPTTSVELVPSVRDAFGFYHSDAAAVLANPRGRIVIDDGRRFLRRVREKFDVIVIDPPPPAEAAGSSLLYSEEFYAAARERLNPGGILATWVPGSVVPVGPAVVQSLVNSFPYVRCFMGLEDAGLHLLASMEPIEQRTATQLAARMPPAAVADLLEWSRGSTPTDYLNPVVSKEQFLNLMPVGPKVRITDDRPYNEYYLLRENGLF